MKFSNRCLRLLFQYLAATVLLEQCEINLTLVTKEAVAVRQIKCLAKKKLITGGPKKHDRF